MGRPREEDITQVEDEGRRFRKGHDYVLEGGGGGGGDGKGITNRESEGENRDILIGIIR